MRLVGMIGVLVAAGFSAEAAPVPLGEDELRAAVAGKTVKIDTPLGTPITVVYSANGLMSGTANAALAVYLGASSDRGRWSVKDGRLCQKWFKWLDAETTCMAIRQDGARIFWKSDTGKTGSATIEPGPAVLAGQSASGLGLPQPPQPPERKVTSEPRPEPAIERPEPVVRPEPAPRLEARRQQPAPLPRAAPSEPAVARLAEPPQNRIPEPPAPVRVDAAIQAPVDAPVQIARALEPPPAPPRFAFSSLIAPQPVSFVPVEREARQVEPFAAAPVADTIAPMREAADGALSASLTHRWCLSNALATAPQPPEPQAPLVATEPSDSDLHGVPSLVSVAYEQVYDGELPLYPASCLTERPAIGNLVVADTSPR